MSNTLNEAPMDHALPAASESPRRRVRISLRALMSLIVLLAVWLGWQVNKARRQREAVAAIARYGGFVYYDWQYVNGKRTPGGSPPAPAWLRRALGDEFFEEVYHVDLVVGTKDGKRSEVERKTDDIIPYLAAFPSMKSLRIHETQATDRAMETIGTLGELEELRMIDPVVTDAGMAHLGRLTRLKSLSVDRLLTGEKAGRLTDRTLESLAGLTQLTSLDIQGQNFSDRGVAHVAGMTELKHLIVSNLLYGTGITDAGLDQIKGLNKLELLGIQGSRVTDAGLDALKGLKALKELWIKNLGRSVSDEAIARLQADLPNLKSVR